MTPSELDARLEAFAARVLEQTASLLDQIRAKDIALQVRRSAAGAWANYGAARVARSHADFTSKIGIALEEMDETYRWLRLIETARFLSGDRITGLVRESGELRAILSASHRTAKLNRKKHRQSGIGR